MVSKVVNKKQNILSVLSGTIIAICITLILILAFAMLIRFCNINDNWIFPVNQIIKIISLFVGTIVILKKDPNKGFFKGLILGFVYFVLAFITFGILQGGFSWNLSNLYDLLLTTLIGGIIGLIVVNIIKK